MSLGISKQNECDLILKKRQSNYDAINNRKIEESQKGVLILGGEVVNSEEIRSDSQDYADLSTVDKAADNTQDKSIIGRVRLNKSPSSSKFSYFF